MTTIESLDGAVPPAVVPHPVPVPPVVVEQRIPVAAILAGRARRDRRRLPVLLRTTRGQ